MRRVPAPTWGGLVVVAAAWAAFGPATDARADQISLRGGGRFRGKVLPDPERPGWVTVIGERGKTPLSFRKEQIATVVAEPSPLDEYVSRRGTTPAEARPQYELGLWCEEQKLTDLAAVHYEAALAADDGFGPAHEKLGHVRYGAKWLHGDELRKAQGLVRDHGKWISREEKEQRDEDRARAAEQVSWARQIRLLRDAIAYGSDDRRREAEAQLLEVREPVAVRPLVSVLGDDSEPMRVLLARALGLIPGPEAARALVGVLLAEGNDEVRRAIVLEAEARRDPEVTKWLVKALRSSTASVVNRSAWALGQLKANAAVPSLIGALVTTRTEAVLMPSVGAAGAEPGVSAGFGTVPPVAPLYGTPIAFNGSSIAYMSGPVVGPGVAAYGAYSVPAYPMPGPLAGVPPGLAASLNGATTGIPGGGGLAASRGPVPRLVSLRVQNVEVHSSLVKLTGQDFGFNVSEWKHWARNSFRSEPAAARRIPQP